MQYLEDNNSSPSFHSKLPEDLLFSFLFPYIDFHDLIRTIPHVCSVWRQVIISKLHTLHLYPNTSGLTNSSSSRASENSIQNDFLPYVRYVIKFVKSNNMKIKQLFVNGQVEDVVWRKQQFGIVNGLQGVCEKKVFIPNRSQRESIQFYNILKDQSQSGGYYFSNSLSEPALRRCTLSSNCGESIYDRLDEIVDSETFKSLKEVCSDVTLVSYSNLVARKNLIDLMCRAKIIVLDNSAVLDNFPDLYFKYAFFTEGFVPFGDYSAEYVDSFVVSSPTFYTAACKSIRFPYWSVSEFLESCKEKPFSALDKANNESVEINISHNDSYTYQSFSPDVAREVIGNICEFLTNCPHLKRLVLGLSFIRSLHGRKMIPPIDYAVVGCSKKQLLLGNVEELYLRGVGDGCSVVNLGCFISKHFENVKSLVMEEVQSKDCLLVRDAIAVMQHNLKSLRISFYNYSGDEGDYEKLLNFLAFTLQHFKKTLEKFSIAFPYIKLCADDEEAGNTLVQILSQHQQQPQNNGSKPNCRILLTRLPSLSNQTRTALEEIPQLVFRTLKPIFDLDSSLPTTIDYDQDIDTIRNQRKLFKQALQKSEIVCHGCKQILPRHLINEHFSTCHSLSDMLEKKKPLPTNVTCPCCREEFKKNELDEHLLICEERDLKIKLHNARDLPYLIHVDGWAFGGEKVEFGPDFPIPIRPLFGN